MADTQNKKVSFIPVRLGIISGELAEVVEPYSLSGHVVILGQHLLSDGSAIILPPNWQETPDTNIADSRPKTDNGQQKSGERK